LNQEKRVKAEKSHLNENGKATRTEGGLVLRAAIVAVPDHAVQFVGEDREAQVGIVVTKKIDQKIQEVKNAKGEFQGGKAQAEKSHRIQCLRAKSLPAKQAQPAI
jgi:hypothetical protein